MHLQIIVSNEKDFTYIKQVPHMAILANWREFIMMTCNIEIKKTHASTLHRKHKICKCK